MTSTLRPQSLPAPTYGDRSHEHEFLTRAWRHSLGNDTRQLGEQRSLRSFADSAVFRGGNLGQC